MSNYIKAMKELAEERSDLLFSGLTSVHFNDFPDYDNVGDSAIALGTLSYLRARNITLQAIEAIGTLSRKTLQTKTPVLLNGGGNIGGFWPVFDEHRYRLARDLDEATPIIQAPQSLHFPTSSALKLFRDNFLRRPLVRIGVRDLEAERIVNGAADYVLAPDMVHHLGSIPSAVPTVRSVTLARRDRESSSRTPSAGTVEWPKDGPLDFVQSQMRWQSKRLGPARSLLNPSVKSWESIAARRFGKGVSLIEPAETIVTDRLHAMLIGLQMGRRVIAVDNENRKLSKYADAWFGASQPDLKFAKSFQRINLN